MRKKNFSSKHPPRNVAEMDYPILKEAFGKKAADKMLLEIAAVNKEARERIGAEKPPEKISS